MPCVFSVQDCRILLFSVHRQLERVRIFQHRNVQGRLPMLVSTAELTSTFTVPAVSCRDQQLKPTQTFSVKSLSRHNYPETTSTKETVGG